MLIEIKTFNGERPFVSPLLLENNFAEVAINCSFERGMLEAMREPGRVQSLPRAGDKPYVFRTIYKHPKEGWLYFDDEVHICKSDVLAEDKQSAYGAIYLTDWITDAFAAYGNPPLQRLLGGNVYRLGIPRPEQALTAECTPKEEEESGSSESGGSEGGSSGGESGSSGNEGGSENPGSTPTLVPYVSGFEKKYLAKGEQVSIAEYDKDTMYVTTDAYGNVMYFIFTAQSSGEYEIPIVKWKEVSQSKSATKTETKSATRTIYQTLVEGEVDHSCAYVYTFVRKLIPGVIEQESATSPPSNVVDVHKDECVTLVNFFVPAGYGVTHIRIYRSVSGTILGSNSAEYQFVDEVEVASDMSYEDCKRDDELSGELCRTMNWDMIPDDAHGLIKTDNGIYACFRGNEVMFSPFFIPYAFPEEYRVQVEDDVVALSHADEAIVILTTGRPYLAVGASPESLQIVRLPVDQACISPQSVVMVQGGVIYASPDGLMLLSANKQELLTESVFTRDQWQNLTFPWILSAMNDETKIGLLKPKNILAAWHDNKYYAFIRGTNIGFIFKPKDKSLVWITLVKTFEIYAIINDVEDDCIYISVRDRQYNNIFKLNVGRRMQYRWKSKRFNLGMLSLMSTVQTTSEYENDYSDDQLLIDKAAQCNASEYSDVEAGYVAGEWTADKVLKYMCIDKGLTIDEWLKRYGRTEENPVQPVKQYFTVNVYAGNCSPEDTPKCSVKCREDKSRRITLKRAERQYSIEIEGKVPIHGIRLGTSVQETEYGQ